MFYCSSGGSEPLSGSKTDIVRGIITEKLTTAAQEIFAVVERIVTDYEAEASGFRQQVDRQRRQLELLQPRVKLLREELVPDQRSHEVVAAGEEEEQPDEEEAAESQDLPPVTDEEDGGDDAGDDDDEQQPPADIGPFQDNLKDPDYTIPSRSNSSMIHQVRKGPGRPRIKDKYDGLELRVRLLEDPKMEGLSNKVFKKAPVQDLKCPRGLQESDFMDLLRSSFPQLANGEPFDLFKTDRRRKLLPLRVKALTPEEIHETVNWPSRCGQLLTLYLRLKNGEQNNLNKEGELCDFPAMVEPPSAEPVHLQNNEAEIHQSVIDKSRDHLSSSLTRSQGQELKPEEGAENDSSNDGQEKLDSGDWDPELEPPTKPKRRGNKSKKAVNQTEKNSCKVCGVWYRQLAGLIKHSWSHVEQQQDVCGVCEEKFDSVEKLKEHLQNHQKLHGCSLCGKTFVSLASLNKHRARHAVKRAFKCLICDQSFDNMSALYHHRLSHREEKPHQCDICQKSFILEKQLTAHREAHSRVDEYSCNICNKPCTDRRGLTQHRLIHSAERRYACEVCGKRFKLHNTLKAHMRTHTVQDRPFLCHICSKTFPSQPGLKKHIRIHSSEKTFICDVCGKTFGSNGSLSLHSKTHSSEAPYQCSECGRCFKHKCHLKNHAFLHSGIKQFVCGICGKACYRQEHLKVHMRTHNGEKPYKCSICEKAFTQSHCLKTHMKIHQTSEIPVAGPPESSVTSSAEPASVLMSSDSELNSARS
nr:zinc finger protein 436 [Nothobranchius furzeri]